MFENRDASIPSIKYRNGLYLKDFKSQIVATSYGRHNVIESNKRNLLYFPNRVPSAKKQNPFEKLIKGGDKVVLLIGSPHPVHIKSVTNFRLKKRKRKNVYTPALRVGGGGPSMQGGAFFSWSHLFLGR